jgi:hypothetical protein
MRAATGFEPSDKWFGQQAVYRISMGNFLFFGCMSLALLGVKYKGEKRGQVLQHGNWVIKLVVWILFNALPFLFPNGMVQAYGACRRAQQLRAQNSIASCSHSCAEQQQQELGKHVNGCTALDMWLRAVRQAVRAHLNSRTCTAA